MRVTPSSVAFCTTKSMRSPRGTHCREGRCERRLAIDVGGPPQRDGDPRATYGFDRGGELPAIAVEQHESVTDPRAQHARNVAGGLGRQFDTVALVECRCDKNAGQAHAIHPMDVAGRALSHMLGGE